MGTRAVLQVFERYQKERVAFVSAVAEMSKSPQVRAISAHASNFLQNFVFTLSLACRRMLRPFSKQAQCRCCALCCWTTFPGAYPLEVSLNRPRSSLVTSLCVTCSIQQSAAMALGRLANYSDDLAEALVQNEVLPQLVYSLSQQNRFYKKAAAFCLRAVAKHSPQLAQVTAEPY